MFKTKIEDFKKNKTNINEINFSELPKSAGIYLIGIKDLNTELIIMENTTAIKKYTSKSLLYKKPDLKRKLENSFDEILYIGKAEAKNGGLKKRITDFLKYANGQPVAHRGGRALWQIQNWQEKLVLYWWMIILLYARD